MLVIIVITCCVYLFMLKLTLPAVRFVVVSKKLSKGVFYPRKNISNIGNKSIAILDDAGFVEIKKQKHLFFIECCKDVLSVGLPIFFLFMMTLQIGTSFNLFKSIELYGFVFFAFTYLALVLGSLFFLCGGILKSIIRLKR